MPISATSLPQPQKYTATVEKKEQLTSRVWFVTFALKDPPSITFLAGQTIVLLITPDVTRSMSIASPPSDAQHILMCHDVSPNGQGSQWTMRLNVGDTVQFMAPLGIFVLDKESHRKKILAATGTGIAPFRSMLYDYLEHGGTDDITLYWGMRYEEDLFWVSEMTALSAKYPNFRFIISLSQPPDTWQGKRGHVTEHIMQEEQNLPGTDFYLCGNQNMIKDVENQLIAKGVPKGQICKELYF
ncbi:hypothetical protein A2Z00_03400 [Candidatus Gottesmanbacteria bacterium RBG_13_45_10]|uniref:FAD-binding FR-type domain-containing protein n=1 Tax=Candidatus Gottesmanbacteria bacterium RBG_13_45_10 TaxID=1798370 RepID=A0A1F5ZHQ8_9BACT|nr:MAG: hypothetical protein A2Z00_03400 [Candidatus Gottesmanbacteria bacterium RBG_13_45_10]